MKKLFRFTGLLLMVFLLSMCGQQQNKQSQLQPVSEKKIDVLEVLQTMQYTYLQVLESNEVKWVAVARQEAQIGDSFYYDSALQMNNFHSNELDRTFEVIYFVNRISKSPMNSMLKPQLPNTHSGRVKSEEKSDILISKPPEELTIGQIFANPAEYSGKEITIRGIVVKVNPEIMGINWIHMQDGTDFGNKFDLTITSHDLPQINSEATFKGTVILNKDFGSGYFYELLVENGVMLQGGRKI